MSQSAFVFFFLPPKDRAISSTSNLTANYNPSKLSKTMSVPVYTEYVLCWSLSWIPKLGQPTTFDLKYLLKVPTEKNIFLNNLTPCSQFSE